MRPRGTHIQSEMLQILREKKLVGHDHGERAHGFMWARQYLARMQLLIELTATQVSRLRTDFISRPPGPD